MTKCGVSIRLLLVISHLLIVATFVKVFPTGKHAIDPPRPRGGNAIWRY